MDQDEQSRRFRTLRGFLRGWEPDGENEFLFDATLRIHGEGVPFDEITQTLGVAPTHAHRKGDQVGTSTAKFRDDAWHFAAPVPDSEPLALHIDELWQVVRPHVEYVRSLKRRFAVDVFCGYRSNCDTAGFEVPHTSLVMFAALEVPFGVSVIVS